MVSLLAAYSRNRVIGNQHAIPWGTSQKSDLQRFRRLTLGNTIVLGRKTFDEFSVPLDNRQHIVISHQSQPATNNVQYMNYEQAATYISQMNEEVFVIGGQDIFELFLPMAQKAYITEIMADYKGDKYFPVLDSDEWQEESNECFSADDSNKHNYCFIDLTRK